MSEACFASAPSALLGLVPAWDRVHSNHMPELQPVLLAGTGSHELLLVLRRLERGTPCHACLPSSEKLHAACAGGAGRRAAARAAAV